LDTYDNDEEEKQRELLIASAVVPDPDPDPGFDYQKLKNKNTTEFFLNFFAIYPELFIKDVQATGEVFSPQKRTSSIQRMKFITVSISIFLGNFCLPGSGSGGPIESGYNPDPVQHRCE
jgi:hypothetical protein